VRGALARAARGERARLPPRVLYHVVAARYGTTPEAVREWPYDDYADAIRFLEVTE